MLNQLDLNAAADVSPPRRNSGENGRKANLLNFASPAKTKTIPQTPLSEGTNDPFASMGMVARYLISKPKIPSLAIFPLLEFCLYNDRFQDHPLSMYQSRSASHSSVVIVQTEGYTEVLQNLTECYAQHDQATLTALVTRTTETLKHLLEAVPSISIIHKDNEDQKSRVITAFISILVLFPQFHLLVAMDRFSMPSPQPKKPDSVKAVTRNVAPTVPVVTAVSNLQYKMSKNTAFDIPISKNAYIERLERDGVTIKRVHYYAALEACSKCLGASPCNPKHCVKHCGYCQRHGHSYTECHQVSRPRPGT